VRVNPIVTLGYGPGVNLIVTMGYGPYTPPVPPPLPILRRPYRKVIVLESPVAQVIELGKVGS
jgi:hypothetical protein